MSITATDPYAGRAVKHVELFDNMEPVTPSDIDELPVVASRLFTQTGGTIKVTTAAGQVVTFGSDDTPANGNTPAKPGTPAGVYLGTPYDRGLPIRIRKVWATGTTATKIWALW